MNLKYPKQLDSVVRTDKTLGVDFELSTPTEKEYEDNRKMPLEMHSGFSRFVLTILVKGKAAKANIPASAAAYIQKKTEFAMEKILEYKMNGNGEEEQLSLAYTQKIFGKNFNKTAAEILQNPNMKNDLIKQRDFLKQNMDKYKANKLQVEAIDEAIRLLDEGKLDKKGVNNSNKTIEIYNEDIKIPNANKIDGDGNTFVYSLSIVCSLDRDYPFAINITNCYAPPVNKGGRVTVEMSKAKDMTKHSILLSEEEFFRIVRKMSSSLEYFENLNFEKQLKLAKDNSYFK